MQNQTRVTFVPINKKCNLKSFSYSIITECKLSAEIMARGLLEQDTKYYKLYKPTFENEVAYHS